ncbi:MAG: thiamine-monophosphate kinase, partial [Phycisphaerae bacterium]|nr:thiamine-monophosphate kinase [Phycisphaerae bacterium]
MRRIADRTRAMSGRGGVEVGPGDDCAVLRVGPGGLLLATVDHLIESRHFETGTPMDLVARKAVARSVSDIAAMAGAPRWAL